MGTGGPRGAHRPIDSRKTLRTGGPRGARRPVDSRGSLRPRGSGGSWSTIGSGRSLRTGRASRTGCSVGSGRSRRTGESCGPRHSGCAIGASKPRESGGPGGPGGSGGSDRSLDSPNTLISLDTLDTLIARRSLWTDRRREAAAVATPAGAGVTARHDQDAAPQGAGVRVGCAVQVGLAFSGDGAVGIRAARHREEQEREAESFHQVLPGNRGRRPARCEIQGTRSVRPVTSPRPPLRWLRRASDGSNRERHRHSRRIQDWRSRKPPPR